jgi:lysophospholipase L1-like esterase
MHVSCRLPSIGKSFLLILSATFALVAPAAAHTLVVFGDSVTAPRAGVRVYGEVLREELLFGDKAIEVINAGVPGNTTVQALKRLDADVLQKRPDTVVVLFGINDAAVDVWKNPPATRPRTPLEAYRTNLKAIAYSLKSVGAHVILMTPNPLYWSETTRKLYGKPPYAPEDRDGFNVILRGYAAAVREVAREEGVALVDVFEVFENQPVVQSGDAVRLIPDGMHPNSEGQGVIAGALIKTLCALDSRYTRAANGR